MRTRDSIIEEVIGIEGGYVNDPFDSGGKTKYGITEAVARANGWDKSMKDLTEEKAIKIYTNSYWNKLYLDSVNQHDSHIAFELFDTAVNCGVSFASKSFQRCLNLLNKQATMYKDIKVDGMVGPVTIRAFESLYSIKNGTYMETLNKMLNCLQGCHYIELGERREKDERYIHGWFKNRIEIRQ